VTERKIEADWKRKAEGIACRKRQNKRKSESESERWRELLRELIENS